MEELIERMKMLGTFDDARYFYHVTNEDAEKILEEGLIVANPSWEQSFLEFTKAELEDVSTIVNENRNSRLRGANAIIVAAVYPEEMQNFVTKLCEDEAYSIVDWQGVGTPDYIVETGYILGYIDLKTLEFRANERCYIPVDCMDL